MGNYSSNTFEYTKDELKRIVFNVNSINELTPELTNAMVEKNVVRLFYQGEVCCDQEQIFVKCIMSGVEWVSNKQWAPLTFSDYCRGIYNKNQDIVILYLIELFVSKYYEGDTRLQKMRNRWNELCDKELKPAYRFQ